MKAGPELPRACVLDDGRKLAIRAIEPDDRGALRATFHGLSPRTRYRRFMGHVSDLTPAMLTYLTEVDGDDHFAVVAVPAGRKSRGAPTEIVGVARMIRLRDDRSSAEIAITVVDLLQGHGCGTLLLETLVEAARERGIERLVAQVLDDNAPMRRLLEKSGPLGRRTDGSVYVTLVRKERRPSLRAPSSLRRGRDAVARMLVAWLRRPGGRRPPPADV